MEKQAKITSKGQITIPRGVRRLLGVREGDRRLFVSDGKEIRVRRILAEFLIGAHAHARGDRLLTLDERAYRAAFPALAIQAV
jgi:AbrB family looped-hinge helix DNA binding protein